MPKQRAETYDADDTLEELHAYDGLDHLRVRRRADLITIESGPTDDPYPHARLRRQTVHLWTLEMATHTGRWQKTPFRGQREELVKMLVENFGWTLSPIC